MALDEQLRQLVHRVAVPPSGDADATLRRGVRRRRRRRAAAVGSAALAPVVLAVGVPSTVGPGPAIPEIVGQPDRPVATEGDDAEGGP